MRIFVFFIFAANLIFAKPILLIGDSMAEAIYKPICSIFESNALACDVYFKRGTRVDYWLKNKQIFENSQNPKIAIITLGTNDLIAKKSNQKIIDELKLLFLEVQKLGVLKSSIFIVATPITNDNNLNYAMKKEFGSNVLESKKLRLAMSYDNIHPTMASDYFWAAKIADEIMSNKRFDEVLKN